MRYSIRIACMSLTLLSTAKGADDLEYIFDGAVEIATGYEKSKRLAPAVVETITAEDINALGVQTFDEVMERVAGVVVQRNRVDDPIYNFRGLYTELNAQVLILLDGSPIGDPVAGGRPIAWNNLVSNIEKIEIVRGPGSAVFGADAYAGVVNIITKGAVRKEISEVGAFGGSFGTYGGHLIASNNIGDARVTITLQGRRTAGDEDRIVSADAQTFLDRLTGTNASNAPAVLPTGRSEVLGRIDAQVSDGLSFYGFHNRYFNVEPAYTSSFLISDETEYNVNLTAVGGAYSTLFNETAFEIKGRALITDLSARTMIAPVGAATPAPPFLFPYAAFNLFEYKTIDGRAEANVTQSFSTHTLRAGIGYIGQYSFDINDFRNFLLTPLGPIPTGNPELLLAEQLGEPQQTNETNRNVVYGFIQDEWQISPNVTLTAGVRYDYYDDIGGAVNPRGSVVWSPTLQTTIKLLYGAAFRPPTFLEVGTIDQGPLVSGNPDLEAETIDTFETSIQHQFGEDLLVELNGFYYRTDNEIVVIDTLAGPAFDNGEGVRGAGVESILSFTPDAPISLKASYTFQDVNHRTTRERAPNTPHHHAFIDVGLEVRSDVSLNIIANYVGKLTRAPGDFRPPVDDYVRTDISLRYKPDFSDNLQFTFAVRNLFDADIVQPTSDPRFAPDDLPDEGRRITAGINIGF